VARRMRLHNGYRTVNEQGALAQIHPGSSQLAADGDGLLPEWLIYNEFVATSRPFLRQVCVCGLGCWEPRTLAEPPCLCERQPPAVFQQLTWPAVSNS
jgi:hypothetical protein